MTSGLVVYATKTALRQAAEGGFEGVFESAVEDAIREGRHFRRLGNGDRLVDVAGLPVRVRKLDRTASGARRLLAVRIEGQHTRREP